MTKPYEVVIDASQFGVQNDIRNQWATQFFQLMPFDASNNLHTVYIYNCNNGMSSSYIFLCEGGGKGTLVLFGRIQEVPEAHVTLRDQQSPEEVCVRVFNY